MNEFLISHQHERKYPLPFSKHNIARYYLEPLEKRTGDRADYRVIFFLRFAQSSKSCFVLLGDGCDPSRVSFQVNHHMRLSDGYTQVTECVILWVTRARCSSMQGRAFVLKLGV